MRKLVIGIVAVVVLHIGFSSYLARDRALLAEKRTLNVEVVKAIHPVVEVGPSVFDVAALIQPPAQPTETPGRKLLGPRTTVVKPTLANYKRPASAKAPVITNAMKAGHARKTVKPFNNSVVAVKPLPRARKEYPAQTSATMAKYSDSDKKQKSDEPLFFAVFKKPAGWIKSVASKVF